MKTLRFVLGAVLALTSLVLMPVDALAGDSFAASTERFGYTGTVTVYDTLRDALSGKNPRFTAIVVPQRDGALFVVRNAPWVWSDANELLTNWYSTDWSVPGANWGKNNPNNTNKGFIQLYDDDSSTWNQRKGFWRDGLSAFTVIVKGKDATYGSPSIPVDYARFWNAGAPAGSGESTKGTFLTYRYELTAYGVNGADPDGDGFYENTTDAVDFAGSFTGVFRNESVSSPASNGYYVFDIQFNGISWADAKGFASSDYFGSDQVTSRK